MFWILKDRISLLLVWRIQGVELHRYFRFIDEAERQHGREDVVGDLEDSMYLLPLLERPRSYIREVRRYFVGERDIRARADGRVFSQISGLADRSVTTTFDVRHREGDIEELYDSGEIVIEPQTFFGNVVGWFAGW